MPVGDFFCCGWGTDDNALHRGANFRPISSLPVCVNPGSAFNSYWEMPFRRRCRMTMTNLSGEDMRLYYQINYTLTEVPEDAAYFHAQFRRVNPLPFKEAYTILDGVRGQGHYVGTTMAWGVHNCGWWGEGEIKFFLDGDGDFPTICGTGTEDYFCGSYNFENRETHRPVPQPAALRTLPLAYHGPGPLRARPTRHHPGPGLAQRRPLPASPGRHRISRVLVPDPADGALPGPAGAGCP